MRILGKKGITRIINISIKHLTGISWETILMRQVDVQYINISLVYLSTSPLW